mmetsp:Transcript_46247/g.33996  ORF Transcript_46247/g.33996 Transcript_46247/m.33996 type:complete len:80 (+) Transcript_46247:239-478(+)
MLMQVKLENSLEEQTIKHLRKLWKQKRTYKSYNRIRTPREWLWSRFSLMRTSSLFKTILRDHLKDRRKTHANTFPQSAR